MRSQSIFSTAFSLVAAIAGVSFLKDTRPPQQPTEAIPTQVIAFDEAKDSEETKRQLDKLTEQMATLGNAVNQLVDKSEELEGLRGSANQQNQQYESMKGQLSEAVEIVKGLKGVNQEQFGQVRSVVNSVGARVKKLEGNAENFDSLSDRVKALEEEIKVLKMRSVVEKPATNTTPNGSTTTEKIVYPSVQGTTSGGSSGSRVVHSVPSSTVYYPPMAYQSPSINYQPVQQVEQQWEVVSKPQWQQATWSPQPAQQTCTRKVWDRRSRTWVCVQ